MIIEQLLNKKSTIDFELLIIFQENNVKTENLVKQVKEYGHKIIKHLYYKFLFVG